ncbi:recombinase family protein [Streptomyces kutzneri]|uniref:recombinase family protein n=1 Tax=Streptomyces kutzneri TaxID=3051179 RepID=UPI0028D5A3F5|nr:recombinase family protein [Streptomyces sp. DSM 40907]
MPRLYGFADNARRRLHEDEVGPLREMASRALLDPPQSDQDIAVWANAQGYRGTLGGEWKDASIGRLLKNPAIAGLRRDDNGELVDAGHPGAITPAEFEALESRRAKRKTAKPDAPYGYLLTGEVGGIASCGKCKQHLTGARNNAGSPGYRCRPTDKQGRGGCGEVRVDAELLETYVAEYLVAELLKPGVRASIEAAQEAIRAQIGDFTQAIAEQEARGREAGDLYGRRQISRDAFLAAQNAVSEELKASRTRLRFAEQMVNFQLGGATDLVRWWNTAPHASKQAIALLFLEGVRVFPASARGVRTIEPGRVMLDWRKRSVR